MEEAPGAGNRHGYSAPGLSKQVARAVVALGPAGGCRLPTAGNSRPSPWERHRNGSRLADFRDWNKVVGRASPGISPWRNQSSIERPLPFDLEVLLVGLVHEQLVEEVEGLGRFAAEHLARSGSTPSPSR